MPGARVMFKRNLGKEIDPQLNVEGKVGKPDSTRNGKRQICYLSPCLFAFSAQICYSFPGFLHIKKSPKKKRKFHLKILFGHKPSFASSKQVLVATMKILTTKL